MKKGVDFLYESQLIIILIGLFLIIFFVVIKVVVIFILFYIGEYGESYVGGRFVMVIRNVGYDVIVIIGKV